MDIIDLLAILIGQLNEMGIVLSYLNTYLLCGSLENLISLDKPGIKLTQKIENVYNNEKFNNKYIQGIKYNVHLGIQHLYGHLPWRLATWPLIDIALSEQKYYIWTTPSPASNPSLAPGCSWPNCVLHWYWPYSPYWQSC